MWYRGLLQDKITCAKFYIYRFRSYRRRKLLASCIALCTGNDNIHLLSSGRRQELRIDMEDWEGNKVYASYDNFTVGSEQEQYKLISIGKYTGTASQYVMKT